MSTDKKDTDPIDPIDRFVPGFLDMAKRLERNRTIKYGIIGECDRQPMFAVSFLKKGRSIVYEERVYVFWSETHQLGTSFKEDHEIGRLYTYNPRNVYCYPFEQFKKSNGICRRKFKIDKDQNSAAASYCRIKDCPTFYLFNEYECPCCGKTTFEEIEPAGPTGWVPTNLDDYFCLDEYLQAVHVSAKAKPKRSVKLRRCHECKDGSLYTIPEKIVENGPPYPPNNWQGLEFLKYDKAEYEREKVKYEREKAEYEIALKFLQFRLWKKYRIKEPNRKSVKRAAERHYRRKQKKLTKSETLFFSTLLGAGAIRRAHEKNYAKK